MSQAVTFIDTSVLCNLLAVPGRDQDHGAVLAEFRRRTAAGHTFILPITTVVETGNHINHVSNGAHRRSCAERFVELLHQTLAHKLPWTLHEFAWNSEFLTALLSGSETGISFVEHAQSGLGCGDLCIICERNTYQRRSGISNVSVWTLDSQLSSHL
ncbi:hypothetical protein ACFXK0_05995 [Nocardia sp. NPDC059177]|uniref:hypothetical protein n=1 Tax=Nocardia sp. NPDC059177 TaxID=3346759 RepID=UPI0036950837